MKTPRYFISLDILLIAVFCVLIIYGTIFVDKYDRKIYTIKQEYNLDYRD